MQKGKKRTAHASPAHAVTNSNHPRKTRTRQINLKGLAYFTRWAVLRQEKQNLMKGCYRLMTDRQAEHRPFFEFFLFLLGRTEQPIDQVMIAWLAAHPIGGADA